MTKLYYEAPSQECFDDMKSAAMVIWESYEDPYRTEKLERIKDIKNISDNFMYLFAMFDIHNQRKCANKLKEETKKALRERMIDGGHPEYLIPF